MVLSIIIPTYNVEEYIAKCLESCLAQNISSDLYEIIVVNDGSTDHSLDIATDFSQRYNNIRIITQENQGLSMARNTGLKAAKGDYIWFVDSDDYIEDNCLSWIFPKLDGNIDLLQIQARHVYGDGAPNVDLPKCILPQGATGMNTLEQGILCVPATFAIYRRKYLIDNDLYFTKGIYHEDCEFTPRALYYATKVDSIEKVCYNYLQRTSGSITSTFKPKRGHDIIFINNSLISFCNTKPMTKKCKQTILQLISTLVNTLLSGIITLEKGERNELVAELKRNKHIFPYMLKSGKIKYIVEGIVLMISVSLGIKLYKALN